MEEVIKSVIFSLKIPMLFPLVIGDNVQPCQGSLTPQGATMDQYREMVLLVIFKIKGRFGI
jgi:hypothetical protein